MSLFDILMFMVLVVIPGCCFCLCLYGLGYSNGYDKGKENKEESK